MCIFLDGENAWEYYPGNGREFLREFYQRIAGDTDFRALTASEAIAAAGRNFGDQHDFSGFCGSTRISTCGYRAPGGRGGLGFAVGRAGSVQQGGGCAGKGPRKRADAGSFEASAGILTDGGGQRLVLVVRSGAQHGGIDAEFDALYRKHLTGFTWRWDR